MEASSSSSSSSSSTSSSIFSSSDFIDNSSIIERRIGDQKKPTTMRFFSDGVSHHFLDACFLCKRPIIAGHDIFMYRGNTPFCSDECREEQMEMDEALEREEERWHRRRVSNSSKTLVKNCAVNKSSEEDNSNGGVIRIHRRPTIINFTPLVAR